MKYIVAHFMNRHLSLGEEKKAPQAMQIKTILLGGESNPGLPRDRRRYSPLYYRGSHEEQQNQVCEVP